MSQMPFKQTLRSFKGFPIYGLLICLLLPLSAAYGWYDVLPLTTMDSTGSYADGTVPTYMGLTQNQCMLVVIAVLAALIIVKFGGKLRLSPKKRNYLAIIILLGALAIVTLFPFEISSGSTGTCGYILQVDTSTNPIVPPECKMCPYACVDNKDRAATCYKLCTPDACKAVEEEPHVSWGSAVYYTGGTGSGSTTKGSTDVCYSGDIWRTIGCSTSGRPTAEYAAAHRSEFKWSGYSIMNGKQYAVWMSKGINRDTVECGGGCKITAGAPACYNSDGSLNNSCQEKRLTGQLRCSGTTQQAQYLQKDCTTAWKTYRTDATACGGSGGGEAPVDDNPGTNPGTDPGNDDGGSSDGGSSDGGSNPGSEIILNPPDDGEINIHPTGSDVRDILFWALVLMIGILALYLLFGRKRK